MSWLTVIGLNLLWCCCVMMSLANFRVYLLIVMVMVINREHNNSA
jgi:hypothetical protein